MPLIIYLDTQDYIRLFNEPEDGPSHEVLSEILAHRDHGDIVIGFSFATILEFITKPDLTNRRERVRRGELVKYICGPNAFPYPTDIAKGAKFPNGGQWQFPLGHKVISANDFRAQMYSIFLAEAAKYPNINRHQRRQLSRKNSFISLMQKLNPTWGESRIDYGGLPVSDEVISSRILERFMAGKCSDAEFEHHMNAWASDPAEYSRIVYDYANMPNVIDAYFGDQRDNVERAMKQIQNAVESVQKANAAILSSRQALISSGVDKSEARRSTKQVSMPDLNASQVERALDALVGLGRARHFSHYLSQAMKPGHTFKPSDTMDLMQMCYAYECDLFRCDKAMESTFKDFEPFSGRLVGRFVDLPQRIRQKLDICG